MSSHEIYDLDAIEVAVLNKPELAALVSWVRLLRERVHELESKLEDCENGIDEFERLDIDSWLRAI